MTDVIEPGQETLTDPGRPTHPARYSKTILAVIAPIIEQEAQRLGVQYDRSTLLLG